MRSDSLARYATRVAIRRVVYLVVIALLAWVGIGRAEAFEQCVSVDVGCTIQQAHQRAVWAAQQDANFCAITGVQNQPQTNGGRIRADYTRRQFVGNPACTGTGSGYGYYAQGCPAGSTWSNEAQKCHSPQQCMDKAALGSGVITAGAGGACIDGCAFGPAPGQGQNTLSFNGTAFVTITRGWGPTGDACSPDVPEPQTEEEMCTPLGDNQTACAKPDGQVCYSAGGGVATKFCWKPGETGQKNHGDKSQVTNAGNEAIPPNMQLPSGDALVPQGPPINTTIHNDNRTINTTTTNYSTENGTDAGGGDGTSKDGEGGEEGEGNTGTGGETCDSPPVVGGDQLLAMIARQTWAARCEGEKANKGDSNDNGQPDWMEQDGAPDVDGDGDGDGETEFLTRRFSSDMLDRAGFGVGASCPSLGTLDFGFTQVSLDSWSGWCTLVGMLRGIVLLFGAFTAIGILLGRA